MNNPEQRYSLFQDFLNKRLSKEDQLDFENRLSQDSDLMKEYEEFKTTHELMIIHELGQVRDQLNSIQLKHTKRTLRKRIAIGAALLILGTSSVLYFWNLKNTGGAHITASANLQEKNNELSFGDSTLETKAFDQKTSRSSIKKLEIVSEVNRKDKRQIIHQIDTMVSSLTITPEVLKPIEKDSFVMPKEMIGYDSLPNKKSVIKNSFVDCHSFHHTIQHKASCYGEENGYIQIEENTKKEKLAIKLNEDIAFTNLDGQIDGLASGEYVLELKNDDGCIQSESIEITEKLCLKEIYYFNYQFDQYWTIPVPNHINAEITVRNNIGALIKKINTKNDGYQWNVLTRDGQQLSQGVYIIMIQVEGESDSYLTSLSITP